MNLVSVIDAQGEAEALMYIEMLKQHNIKAFKFLPTNQQFLRSYYGGASMPFDVWEVKVPEVDALRAKQILPEHQQEFRTVPAEMSKSAKAFVTFMLTSVLLGVAYSLVEMIKYFLNS